MPDAVLIDVYTNLVPAYQAAGLTISPRSAVEVNGAAFLDCAFGAFRQGTPGAPANGNGFCLDGDIPTITVNVPVAAFGLTSQQPVLQSVWGVVNAYDGPDGTENFLKRFKGY